MKTIRKIFLLLPVLLAAAVSCDKKETETDGVLAVFSAEIDDGELTKAYVTGATGVISWENGDQITV
ncbi:MAG: hypothetical protein J5871_07065, partial [Bacteroidales bacterium]|nr:hypothetical protein [Bacteroidales bacterium]